MEPKLCDINTCTQCQACVQACPKRCITMTDASDGFKLPSVNADDCIECGKCMQVCHQISPKLEYHTPLATYACWTKLMSDRKKSSSGGAFSVLARKVLSQGGIVFGASMCPDLQVRHIAIRDEADLIKIQGSKYVQSDIGNTYNEARSILSSGVHVLFSGTPCQIAGLKTFLRKEYDNLLTCDVVCHGVPSQKAFDIYMDRINATNTSSGFSFRYTEGWGFRLSRQPVTPTPGGVSGKKVISPSKAYYLRAFTNGLMFDESCYTCPYARPERISDITLADYWGLGNTKPFRHSTLHGISCMLINTQKGKRIISECPNLEYEERTLEEAVMGNHNLSHVSNRPTGRDTYFDDSLSMPISALCKKYSIKASWRDYMRLFKQFVNAHR